MRIYEQFEAMLCYGSSHNPGCSCSRLKSYYSTRLFRCNHVICFSQRIAFETRSLRNSHTACHNRLFKCTVATCDFAKIGFRSDCQREQHQLRSHEDPTPTPRRPIDNPSDDEIQPLLFDLVTMGRLEDVRQLLPQFLALDDHVKRQLQNLAAFNGPLAIVQLLTEDWTPSIDFPETLAINAIRGENTEVLEWIFLTRNFGQQQTLTGTNRAAISASDDIFNLWKKISLSRAKSMDTFFQTSIGLIQNPVSQMRLADLWKTLASHGCFSQNQLQSALNAVALRNRSVVLAKALIECGAQIGLLLGYAATGTSRKAAEMIKFLLLGGADPSEITTSSPKGGVPITLLSQQIQKHLGMTWDELVKWTQEQRKTKTERELLDYVETDII